MIKGVIFDMDGVLADTEHFYQTRRERFLCQMDFPHPSGMDFIGSNERVIWETLVPEDPVMREEMMMGYRAYQKLHPVQYGELLDPEICFVFKKLKENGIKTAIASSSNRRDIRDMMACAGIESLVDFVISGGDCTAHKPAPEIYLRALEALGLDAGEALAVEDSPIGILAAKNAGIWVLGFVPRHGEKLDQSAADGKICRLSQVLEHVL
ncbi:MAG: HAD family phosphatase [Clostridium sp.]|nr:HAD family phosphatase [Clostridium sp.]